MAWVKVPAENHAPFIAALPLETDVETAKMFGGVAAKVNGHIFAGLFGLSTMLVLGEADKKEALALDGAGPFDPMGDGRARSEKVMLPPVMMKDPARLAAWIRRAYEHARALPVRAPKTKRRTGVGAARTRSTQPPRREK